MPSVVALVAVLSCLASLATAETHKITITNSCGRGTPKVRDGSSIIHEGDSEYVHEGALTSGLAWLADERCPDHPAGVDNINGCSLLEFTLNQGDTSGDISLIPPNVFTDAVGFEFTDGCAGTGAACGEDGCNTAYYVSNDDCVVVGCPENDVGIHLTFCGVTTGFTGSDDPNQEGQQGSPCDGSSNNTTASESGGSASASGSGGDASASGSGGDASASGSGSAASASESASPATQDSETAV